jgi:hypothetical protein
MQISFLIWLNYAPKIFEKQDLAVAKARIVAAHKHINCCRLFKTMLSQSLYLNISGVLEVGLLLQLLLFTFLFDYTKICSQLFHHHFYFTFLTQPHQWHSALKHFNIQCYTDNLKTISPFGELIKNIKIQTYQEEMRLPVKKTNFSHHGGKLKPSPIQPVLFLLPEILATKDQDKSKFINFELKSCASQPRRVNYLHEVCACV